MRRTEVLATSSSDLAALRGRLEADDLGDACPRCKATGECPAWCVALDGVVDEDTDLVTVSVDRAHPTRLVRSGVGGTLADLDRDDPLPLIPERTATAPQVWVVVDAADHDADYSYASATVVAGPFPTHSEAHEYIGWDERYIAVRRDEESGR